MEQLCDIAANCFKVGTARGARRAAASHARTALTPPRALPSQAEDVLRMELLVLDTLLWRTKMPTSYTFLHLFAQALPFCTYNTVCLASYLLVSTPACASSSGAVAPAAAAPTGEARGAMAPIVRAALTCAPLAVALIAY